MHVGKTVKCCIVIFTAFLLKLEIVGLFFFFSKIRFSLVKKKSGSEKGASKII